MTQTPMFISEEGMELIRRFEGFSAIPYKCPAGYPTIGYGHMIQKGEDFSDKSISRQQAENLLKQDVSVFENKINRLVDCALSQYQFDALVSLCYNIGIHAFEKSTLLSLLNDGKMEEAAAQFSRWVYTKGRKLAGLEQRRLAEKQLFLKKPTFS